MDLRIGHIFVVLICSFAGCLVCFSNFLPTGVPFFVLKSVSTGIILGLAFVHLIPEASELREKTPFGALDGIFIMIGLLLSMVADSFDLPITQPYSSPLDLKAPNNVDVVHVPNPDPSQDSKTSCPDFPEAVESGGGTLTKPFGHHSQHATNLGVGSWTLTVHLLEAGMIVHTVLLGIVVGMWTGSRTALVAFTVAMGFHQFFEGISVGVALRAAGSSMTTCRKAAMIVAFGLSFPVSVCIGIGLSTVTVDSHLQTWIMGVLNAVACGILLHVALVTFVARDMRSDFLSQPDNLALRVCAMFGMAVGMAAMSVIGIWG